MDTYCFVQKYGDLLKEVDRLRQLLRMGRNDSTHAVQDKHEDWKAKTELRKDEEKFIRSALPHDLRAKQNQSQIEATSKGHEKEVTVESMDPHHPRDLRKGRKGDDGPNVKAKLQEKSVLKSLGLLMGGIGTARKPVNLTNEERKQRDKKFAVEHMKNHRIH